MMDLDRLKDLLAGGETLEVEFKSDRQQISDNDIYEEIVAFANTRGGVLLVGVEDDGMVTGAKPRHGSSTDPVRLQAAIFNNTVPSINTRTSVVPHEDGPVLTVEVDRYPEVCATAQGRALRRVIGGDGRPAAVPFYPHEHLSRRSDLGLLDYSAQPVEGADFSSLDPLEFERLRQTIPRRGGDRALLDLADEDTAKALRLVESDGNKLVPNVAGLLLLGREEAITRLVPTHEVHFQVIDAQGDVRVNDTFRGPLLHVLEDLEARFNARNEEREVLVGLIRLPVPDYSFDGYREAISNAVLHRDYTRLGQVYVQWHPDHVLIANPGGFPEGITVDNILVHEPKPRNPRLADAFKRVGIVEQTGRGVDKIFMGQVRYGRPIPDYSRSAADGVRVVLRGGESSLQFAALVYEQEKQGVTLTLDDLIVLNLLHHERRINSATAGQAIQKGINEGRATLERLHERGLVEARGEGRGRVYHMAASLYRRLGETDGYVRTRGFDQVQQMQMILNALQVEGAITRSAAARLCQVSVRRASYLLQKMAGEGHLEPHGMGRGSYYTLKQTK
jgi:ATP-dependent DNA helicase RecG